MSDLEDDVLMQLIEASKKLSYYKERHDLVETVWKDLDRLLRAILRDPYLVRHLDKDLEQLKKSVVAVLEYDKKSGPDAPPHDRVG